jgi:hypothetical protein
MTSLASEHPAYQELQEERKRPRRVTMAVVPFMNDEKGCWVHTPHMFFGHPFDPFLIHFNVQTSGCKLVFL